MLGQRVAVQLCLGGGASTVQGDQGRCLERRWEARFFMGRVFPPSRAPSSSLCGEQHPLELHSLWPAHLLCAERVLPVSECRRGWDQMNHVTAASQTRSQALSLCDIQAFPSVKSVLRTLTFLSRWGGLIRYLISLSIGKNY